MLYSYLTESGADVDYYIPERSEGYGLNKNAVMSIAGKGADIIITVDNGISAIPEAELIYECGMKLIVTDHHQPGEILPHAEAIINPHKHDISPNFRYLCGAGVVLKLIAALEEGDYTVALEQFGDLAAIATVADIVSLMSENRFITSYGMHLIENTDRPALVAMKDVCGLSEKHIDSTSIGFGIAPRINAAGRFGSPRTAAELFLCEDFEKCTELADNLNQLNTQRKETEAVISREIYDMIDKNPMLIHERVIFLCGKNWHHGVIGIVASKIEEKFGKPCFIASESNGEIRGSARAFGDFSVFDALVYCADTLEKYGGHKGAGGFTIKSGMADDFNRHLQEYALVYHKHMPVLTINADTSLLPSHLTVDNVKGLQILEPYGEGNEKPLFLIENAMITGITPLSDGSHSKLRLRFGNSEIYALVFRTSPSDLTVKLNDVCDFIVTLDINTFRDTESVSIIVKDYKLHSLEQDRILAAEESFEMLLRHEIMPVNYYRQMLPVRDDVVKIYLGIPENGININKLFLLVHSRKMNYCKFLVAVEALRQLGLISYTSESNSISRIRTTGKADLQSAPILMEINAKMK
jgi:single-stranded-DNA-specific exonuclease